MQAAGTILVLIWMTMIVIRVIALIRGHIDWSAASTTCWSTG